MKNRQNNIQQGGFSPLGFSFIELIIVISLLALLAVVGMSYQGASNQKTKNTRITADLGTLNNSILSYKEAEKTLPEPKGNKNFFSSTGTYEHDNTNAFGVHGFVTDNLLPKKYLNYLPLDPRTNQFYAYGKTKDNKSYEVAGVVNIEGEYQTKLQGNYTAENGPYSLIREYNGPAFISDKSKTHFPYNPTERQLVGKISDISGTVKIISNGNTITGNDVKKHTLVKGDKIEVSAGDSATIFFSDGSQSLLGDNSHVSKLELTELKFQSEDNLLTRIQLTLDSGILWTKATNLNSEDGQSDFEVSAQDITAAVRGTIFGVENNGSTTNIQVIKGVVEIIKNNSKSKIGDGESSNNYNGTISIPIFPQTVKNFLTGSTIASTDILTQAEDYAKQETPKTLTGDCPSKNNAIDVKDNGYSKIHYNVKNLANNKTDIVSYKPKKDNGIYETKVKFTCTNGIITYKIDPNYTFSSCINGYILDNTTNKCVQKCDMKIGTECYKLYAKAEYDNCNNTVEDNGGTYNINKFKDFFKLIKKEGGEIKPDTNFGGTHYDSWKNVCKTTGFFIDNHSTAEYIKYSNLNLGNNFAIEMSVYIPNSYKTGGPYYLINGAKDGNDGFKLMIRNGKINNKFSLDTSRYFGNKFHTFLIDNSGKVQIDGKYVGKISKINNFNELYVGVNYNKTNVKNSIIISYSDQLNSIINYLKIYTK